MRPFLAEQGELAYVRLHAVAADAEDDTDPVGVPGGRGESGVRHGLTGGHQGELAETVQPTGQAAPEHGLRVEIDGAGEIDGKARQHGITPGETPARAHAVPGRGGVPAGRGDHADAGDGGFSRHGASFGWWRVSGSPRDRGRPGTWERRAWGRAMRG